MSTRFFLFRDVIRIGGNNHGCQEYSKKFAFYTQADRLSTKKIGHARIIGIVRLDLSRAGGVFTEVRASNLVTSDESYDIKIHAWHLFYL